jgi:hypothetical protein
VRNRLKVWIAVSAEDVAERITDAIVSADGITVTVRARGGGRLSAA